MSQFGQSDELYDDFSINQPSTEKEYVKSEWKKMKKQAGSQFFVNVAKMTNRGFSLLVVFFGLCLGFVPRMLLQFIIYVPQISDDAKLSYWLKLSIFGWSMLSFIHIFIFFNSEVIPFHLSMILCFVVLLQMGAYFYVCYYRYIKKPFDLNDEFDYIQFYTFVALDFLGVIFKYWNFGVIIQHFFTYNKWKRLTISEWKSEQEKDQNEPGSQKIAQHQKVKESDEGGEADFSDSGSSNIEETTKSMSVKQRE